MLRVILSGCSMMHWQTICRPDNRTGNEKPEYPMCQICILSVCGGCRYFGRHGMFHDYLEEFDAKHMRKAVIELFQVLDTKPKDRDLYLEESLSAFPYVNGGLFANENIEIPQFTEEIRQLLLEKHPQILIGQKSVRLFSELYLKAH